MMPPQNYTARSAASSPSAFFPPSPFETPTAYIPSIPRPGKVVNPIIASQSVFIPEKYNPSETSTPPDHFWALLTLIIILLDLGANLAGHSLINRLPLKVLAARGTKAVGRIHGFLQRVALPSEYVIGVLARSGAISQVSVTMPRR
jgi:hypothetical protein